MTGPSFPAAEVTSADQLLSQMCGGFAQTTVFLETWSPSRAGALRPSRSRRASSTGQMGCAWPGLPLNPLVCTTWAEQHKPDPAQASSVVVPVFVPGAPRTRPSVSSQSTRPERPTETRKRFTGCHRRVQVGRDVKYHLCVSYIAEGIVFCVCLESLSSDCDAGWLYHRVRLHMCVSHHITAK